MPAGRPKSIDNSRVFDVSKPGKSKPVGTSRPVITTSGKIMKNPGAANEPPSAPLPAPSESRKIINPVSSEAPVEDDGSEKISVKVGAPAKVLEEMPEAEATETEESAPLLPPSESSESEAEEPVEPEAATTDEPEAETPAETETEEKEDAPEEAASEEDTEPKKEEGEGNSEQAGSETGSVDALAEATQKKKQDEKEAEEQAKRDAGLQALIDSKKYFVPLEHDSSKKKGHAGSMILILILVLAAGAYMAVDAKLIDVSYKLPYEFIK